MSVDNRAESDAETQETRHALPPREIWACPHCWEETHKGPFGGFWDCPSCRSSVFPDEVVYRGDGWL